ncbi:putative PurR-regulated permease PerM [Paenibacillus sp. DS2015]|uniref:AI-2E family transporter n=1 Tax=Paenibacillus sp. DS2015 TaxID=3373917 RepID=UPI003D18FF6E
MLQSKYLRTCLSIIATLLIIYLSYKVNFLFIPLVSIFNLLLVPIVLSGFLFYLLRPIVNYLDHRKMNRSLAILLIYFVFAGLIALFFILVWPTLQEQISTFIQNTPSLMEDLQKQLNKYQNNRFLSRIIPTQSEITANISNYVNRLISVVTDSIANLVTVVSNVVIVLATIPIILYYMLKESNKLAPKVLHLLPRRYRKDGKEVCEEIDSAISNFIVGRVILNLILGVMMYIGFLIIGLPYALLLALISAILNLIPYIGALLATVPVVIVALTVSPTIAFWSLIIIIITQQIQDNILSPIIYGKQLDIHPLTTVILLLIGADFYGLMGVILAIPAYMIVKIIVVRIYGLFLSEKIEEIIE